MRRLEPRFDFIRIGQYPNEERGEDGSVDWTSGSLLDTGTETHLGALELYLRPTLHLGLLGL
jgi:hypothetical protein